MPRRIKAKPAKPAKPAPLSVLLEKQRARRAEQIGIATSRRLQADAVAEVSQRLVASMSSGIREQLATGELSGRVSMALKLAQKREPGGDGNHLAVALAIILEEQTQRVGRYLADQAQEWRDVSSAAAGAANELGAAISELEAVAAG